MYKDHKDASEYLHSIRNISRIIHDRKEELDRIDEMLKMSSIQYSPDKVQSSMRQDTLENNAIKHLEKRTALLKEIEDDITWMMERQHEAVGYISKMESKEQREVLKLRYIDCKDWAEILMLRGCDSIESQYRLHRKALENFQKILEGYSKASI